MDINKIFIVFSDAKNASDWEKEREVIGVYIIHICIERQAG